MKLLLGNCLDKMREMEDNSIDAIVTDPPYGLSFMGKKWDYDVPSVEIWEECLRVLKPGGYLLSFAGTRTQHRMAVRIEDAGFEIRDMIAWIYGSGFPKSLNIGKAVDKLQGDEREETHKETKADSTYHTQNVGEEITGTSTYSVTKGTSEWEGWGTALKPALEPITVAIKPREGTFAENCLKWGVGGINIDGCRVEIDKDDPNQRPNGSIPLSEGGKTSMFKQGGRNPEIGGDTLNMKQGRFPANLIHDGSDEVVELFPNTSPSRPHKNKPSGTSTGTFGMGNEGAFSNFNDSGSAARFFYCAKASKKERNMGCEDMEEQTVNDGREKDIDNAFQRGITPRKNTHPTVKPIALMEYLVKLVSREGQVVLDPFMGSGTTGMACKKLNREFIGMEMNEDYMKIAKARIDVV